MQAIALFIVTTLILCAVVAAFVQPLVCIGILAVAGLIAHTANII